jgi:hypothetical protein
MAAQLRKACSGLVSAAFFLYNGPHPGVRIIVYKAFSSAGSHFDGMRNALKRLEWGEGNRWTRCNREWDGNVRVTVVGGYEASNPRGRRAEDARDRLRFQARHNRPLNSLLAGGNRAILKLERWGRWDEDRGERALAVVSSHQLVLVSYPTNYNVTPS